MQVIRYSNKLGRFLEITHPQAEVYALGPEQIQTGFEQIPNGYEQRNVGTDEEPVYEDDLTKPLFLQGRPVHEPGPERFAVEWKEDWGSPPTDEEIDAWAEANPIQPVDPAPVTDVNSPIKAILTGYQESEAARAQRIALLKSSASYALGAKIGAELAAANPPSNAEELAALKAEAKGQASALGGAFFDSYFSWIGAYREGGGPGFLAAVQADTSTAFLDWPTPPNGITLPDGTIVLAEGGVVRDLFTHFLS